MFATGAHTVMCPVQGLPDRLPLDQLGLIEEASGDPAAYPLAMSHLFGTARMSRRPADGVVGPDFSCRVHNSRAITDHQSCLTNRDDRTPAAKIVKKRLDVAVLSRRGP
jgi:hypothetical protein